MAQDRAAGRKWRASRTIVVATALALGAAVPGTAQALCFGASPRVERISLVIGRDPAEGLHLAERMLVAGGAGLSTREIAELQALRSLALLSEGQPDPQVAQHAATAAARLGPAHPAALNLALLSYARDTDRDELAQHMRMLRDRRSWREPLDAGQTCVDVNLGYFLLNSGYPDEALPLLVSAYDSAERLKLGYPRARAAAFLAFVMAAQWDYERAAELMNEAVAFARAHGLNDIVSGHLVDQANFAAGYQNFAKALPSLRLARHYAAKSGNPASIGYTEAALCNAYLRLHQPQQALDACDRGLRHYAATDDALVQQATALKAEAYVDLGRASDALRLFDPILRGRASDAVLFNAESAYLARARAFAMVGDYQRAYADVVHAGTIGKETRTREWELSSIVTRARFVDQRQRARNVVLSKQLSWSRKLRTSRERTLLLGGVTAAVIIGLLTTLLAMSARHRRSLRDLASRDALTGLGNRRTVEDALRAALAADPARPVAIALFDLDHFKAVNDSYGHAAGDAVLRHFAEVAKHHVPAAATLGRWGGEEFLLVLPGADSRQAKEITEAIRRTAAERVIPDLPDYRIRFSAGVAARQGAPATPAVLTHAADVALYEAKRRGRDCTMLAEEADDHAAPMQEPPAEQRFAKVCDELLMGAAATASRTAAAPSGSTPRRRLLRVG